MYPLHKSTPARLCDYVIAPFWKINLPEWKQNETQIGSTKNEIYIYINKCKQSLVTYLFVSWPGRWFWYIFYYFLKINIINGLTLRDEPETNRQEQNRQYSERGRFGFLSVLWLNTSGCIDNETQHHSFISAVIQCRFSNAMIFLYQLLFQARLRFRLLNWMQFVGKSV